MTCDRCEECRSKGNNFCRYCGEKLDPCIPRSGCEHCDECKANGDRFCRYCGKDLIEPEHPLLKIGFVVGFVTSLVLGMILLFEYAVAIWGIPRVLPNLPDYGSGLILVVPQVVTIVRFNGVLSQIYYILLFIALSVSLAFFLIKAYRPMIELKNGDDQTVRRTAFFEVPVLFSVLFFWEIIFILVLEAMGVEVKGPGDMDDWKWMYELLEASVWEEIITRILFIGVPMALIAAIMKHEGGSSTRYLFGGFGINRSAMVLIFFSAFMFGAGHLTNWGTWKFFPTFVFGLIAGYLFCRYGVYATIMIHFLTDYLSAESWLTGSDITMSTLIVILLSFACMPYTYLYLKRGVLMLRDVIRDQSNDFR